jgi:hypothetical protein
MSFFSSLFSLLSSLFSTSSSNPDQLRELPGSSIPGNLSLVSGMFIAKGVFAIPEVTEVLAGAARWLGLALQWLLASIPELLTDLMTRLQSLRLREENESSLSARTRSLSY